MVTERDVTQAFERYGHLVLRRCQRILRDQAMAEDAMQETFYRLWRYGDSFMAADSQVSWLWRVAERCCFDALAKRHNAERVVQATMQASSDPHPQSVSTTETAFIERQTVLRMLARFETRVQQLAILHYLGELTQEEIAELTGWSRQTVNKKLASVRDRVRRWRAEEMQ
jgi:RNA polymerase sigma-70 factor (ECF subfamily)